MTISPLIQSVSRPNVARFEVSTAHFMLRCWRRVPIILHLMFMPLQRRERVREKGSDNGIDGPGFRGEKLYQWLTATPPRAGQSGIVQNTQSESAKP